MKKHIDIIPSVCIVGRPNVGKSSLFNHLLGRRKAVVIEESGTTRDRVSAVVNINDHRFKIVDTGGYLPGDIDEISGKVKKQIYRAVEEASLVIMVTDAIDGIMTADRQVAEVLRKSGQTVILAVNKADNKKFENEAVEFYALGFGDPTSISCLHGKGFKDLKKRIIASSVSLLKHSRESEPEAMKIAVVGRPNVGKSSFVNYLLKKERVIVSSIPGTTRDSIDSEFTYDGDEYILVDTAGIRHKRKIKSVVDTFSIMRSKESIKRADVVMLLLDAADGMTNDDSGILDFIEENGKACLVLVNKWDLAREVDGVTAEEYERQIVYASPRLRIFPMLFTSAASGKGVLKSLSVARVLNANLDLKTPTPLLNGLFKENDPSRVPIPRRKKRPNFLYITQTSCRPIEFSYFINDPQAVLSAHLNFIENVLRDNLSLKGIAIKIKLKRSRKGKR